MRISYFYIAIVLAAFSCGKKTKQQATETKPLPNVVQLTDAQAGNVAIKTALLSRRSMASELKVNGKIDVPPQHLVSVTAPLGGYLRSSRLLPGMHINKGDVLAVLEDPQYIELQRDYLLAKSKLHFAELEYNRQKDLNASQASSDKVTQQAQAEMNNQRITMNALGEKLRMININPLQLTENNISRSIQLRSTLTGYVSKVNVNIGRYVNPPDVLFELINPEDIHLNLSVFEKDINKLFIGQKLMAYTNADPAKKYPCEILLISKDVGNDGVTEVHCHFEKYDHTLLPGLYMNAEIAITTSNGYALPTESIVHYEGSDYVFVQTAKQRYEMRPVTTGITSDGFTEITNEDLQNQQIVTEGAYTLLMTLKNSGDEE